MNHHRQCRILMLLENESFPDDIRVHLEAKALVNAGYGVRVICPTGKLGRGLFDVVDGVHVHRYPKPWELPGVLGYAWEYGYSLSMAMLLSVYVLLRHGFDVLHAHAPPDMFCLVAAFYKALGKRFVFDHHDLSPELYAAQAGGQGNAVLRRLLLMFERGCCLLADQLIATNETQRKVQVERGGASPDRTSVVRNGPELATCVAEGDVRAKPPGAPLVIGYLGVMGFQDGVDALIRALAHLRHDLGRTDFSAKIIGNGPAVPSLRRLVKELHLADCVEFTGYLVGTELHDAMSSIDIATTPDPSNAYNDSCTMIKVMEYMALGKPIVAFDLPESRITAGDAAWFATGNNVEEFARGMSHLMDDPQRRHQMGLAGLQRVKDRFAWDFQKEHLLNVYARVLPVASATETASATPATVRPVARAVTDAAPKRISI